METILQEGVFKDSQEKGKEYLLYLEVDRLIAPCYEAVGQEPKKPRYGGWESTGISGHSIGHWLSAAAQMYAVTKDEKLKEKVNYAVDELAHVQSYDEDGYVSGFSRTCFDTVFTGKFEVEHFSLAGQWVPWYSIHKIYAGLLDVYQLLRHPKALDVVIKLADWAKKGTDNLSEEQFQKMLVCEHGGMNEAMADLYVLTKNEDYLHLAKRFCHQLVLEPLAQNKDVLEGKHANTQIPKVIGAAKLYDITGEEKYKRMALFFWNEVTKKRSYIIGGNSINEHFGPTNSEKLGVQTTETCNTYNMLKLTECLFNWSQEGKYFDFYETALYNHILASQDPQTGMKTYFVSTQPGHFKVYCSPDNSFWCCTGTGMENPARYTRNIYTQKDGKLFVNLFIASRFETEDKKIKGKQETNFPYDDRTTITLDAIEESTSSICFRLPYWGTDQITISINGEKRMYSIESGYAVITRKWSHGDKIDITLPMDLHLYKAKDEPNKVGFMYGPVVLAGALGKENFPETDILGDHLALNNHPLIDVPVLVADKTNIKEWIKKSEDEPLTFKTDPVGQPGHCQVRLIPFFALHHERYTLYWNVMDEEAFRTFVDKEQKELERLRKITVDEVQPNEQQPEVEHHIEKKNSRSGYVATVERGWRDCRDDGYFSYTMKVDPTKQMYLQVQYFGGDRTFILDGKTYERHFHILVDDTVIAEQRLDANEPFEELINAYYDIPLELTSGKQTVKVTFKSTEGKVAGGVYGVRIINTMEK